MAFQDPDTPSKLKKPSVSRRVRAVQVTVSSSRTNPPQNFELMAEVYVRKTMFKSLFPQRVEDCTVQRGPGRIPQRG